MSGNDITKKATIPLHTIQMWMKNAIATQGIVDDVLHSSELESIIPYKDATNLLLPSKSLSNTERLDIYRKMYVLRMVDAMESDFPVLATYLNERFHTVVMDYVAVYPSRSYTLNHLGNDFHYFLRGYELGEDKELICELALLEHAISTVIDIEETPTLNHNELGSINAEQWETLILKPVKALKVFKLSTNAVAFLNASDNNLELPEPISQESYVMVFRLDYTTDYVEMNKVEFDLLEIILNGNSLLKSFDLLMQKTYLQNDIDGAHVFGMFQTWVQRGIFQSLTQSLAD